MRNIAIIPARSGSKGLKDKNIRELINKPLIAYTIEAALESCLFDEVHVSTDSIDYANIAIGFGASVPFLRSELTSTDTSSTIDVIKETIEKYKKHEKYFDTATILQPTSPLRTANNIINGFKLFNEKKAFSVVSVCEVDHSPLWSNTLPSDNSMINFFDDSVLGKRRQELPSYYRVNGALYIIDLKLLHKSDDIYEENSYAYIMKKEESVDIDDAFDFKFAEFLMGMKVSK